MNKLLILLMFLGLTSVSFATNLQGKFANKKILIAYYSRSGNTEIIAKSIQSKIGGELFKIETATPYPNDYRKTTEVAKKQIENNEKPALKSEKSVAEYDVIFVGTPTWWGKMTPAVMTFLTNNNFKGKIIIPFITHGGGGAYSIASDMGKATEGKVLESFSIYGSEDELTINSSAGEKKLNSWLSGLNL